MKTLPSKTRASEDTAALNEFFRVAHLAIPLEDVLHQCLDILLSISWFSKLPKAGLFLAEYPPSEPARLRLVANRNMGEEISTLCATVPFGQCLCGQAAQTGLPVFASEIDERHKIHFEGMQPHGHYNIPIISSDRVLGVLVFYLPHGSQQSQEQQDFLLRCTTVLALVIELRTKERALEEKVRELNQQKMTLDEHAIVSIADVQGRIIYANEKFCAISGYSMPELLGKNHRILKSGAHSEKFYEDIWRTITAGQVWRGDIKNRKKDGSHYWVNATIVPFLNNQGKIVQYVAVRTDITERKEMEYALKQAQSVGRMGSWSLSQPEHKLIWSEEIYRIFGMDPEQFGASLEAFLAMVHPADAQNVSEQFQASLEGKCDYDVEHRIIRKDSGEIRWVHERCLHQRDDAGNVIRSDGTVQDITEQKLAQEEIHRLARTDTLTGLFNRGHFYRRLEESLKLARREKWQLGLMLLDLDKFKPVNDTFGHQVGDALLEDVARIFLKAARETDVVGRLGGDEFAILLINPGTKDNIEQVAQRIIAEVGKPRTILGQTIVIGVSIGVSLFPENAEADDRLIQEADLALYEAKRNGRNHACFYADGMTMK